ncbi:MAG: PP2C family protein-serine/threonine phosphatase [Melioribacteraceae bacterium]|nr:PP2C family protein-serine/threonine phosphatase [Melioribacteraceae bacterium]
MTQPDLTSLFDKLNLQVKSFQEGFEVLSQSKKLEELAKHFSHILRGNLLTLNVNIFYKKDIDSEWCELYLYKKKSKEFLNQVEIGELPRIIYLQDAFIKIAISLPLIDKSYFALLIGGKVDNSEFSELDKLTLQIFLQLLGNGYIAFLNQKKVKELLFSLNHRILQLNSLIDTGIEISSLEKSDSLLDLALERSVMLTNASAGSISIYEGDQLLKTVNFPTALDQNYVINSQHKLQTKFEFMGRLYVFTVLEKESRDGIVDFDDTDEILLSAFARQLNSAIENEHLHKEALENETNKKEISLAAEIQQKIIPSILPEIKGYEVAGINIPSKEVGGDYYDCIKLNDGRYALVIADVAGKGVPAALLVSTLNASLNAYLNSQIQLDELAARMNKVIYKASPSNKFITFFIAVLSPESGELDIINAGHNPSLILKNDKRLYRVEAGGVALGMFDMNLPYAGEKLIFNKGDKLLLYTDGIPEAMNSAEEEYSDEKLEEFYLLNSDCAASEFLDKLVAEVRKHTADTPQSDDITALLLIRK